MKRRPLPWRVRWALAQVTGVLFSSTVWILLLAAAPAWMFGALLAGTAVVLAFRTRLALRLAFGATPAEPADHDAVLRAIVPVASLRGRNQPRILVATGRRARGWDVTAADRRTLLVSEATLSQLRGGTIADLEFSARVARTLGQLPALGSRTVLAVDLYCLPWTAAHLLPAGISSLLARIPLMSCVWRGRLIVFALSLLDAVQHARWEAALPLIVLSVLTYTTGPLNRAWRRRLADLGERRVADEGLNGGSAGHSQDGPSHVERLGAFR